MELLCRRFSSRFVRNVSRSHGGSPCMPAVITAPSVSLAVPDYQINRPGMTSQARCNASGVLSGAATGEMTTDATFRYRSFEWRTSCGERHHYEYIVAQQPAGGGTARDALSALEENLPQPASGRVVVLIPSVSMVCSGKEEMRPLATLLSQRGHRCYILEWPGWTQNVQTNWALGHCKMEALKLEYEDFWCSVLEHVALEEDALATEARKKAEEHSRSTSAGNLGAPRICVVGAGSSGIYALRALQKLRSWEPPAEIADELPKTMASREVLKTLESLVLVAPSWQTDHKRLGGYLQYLSPQRASKIMAGILHADTRFGRMYRNRHSTTKNMKRHFLHAGATDTDQERLFPLASWLFQRPRPFRQVDVAASCGFLDPLKSDDLSVSNLANEVNEASFQLQGGVMLLSPGQPSSGGGKHPSQLLEEELLFDQKAKHSVECSRIESSSELPHEIATTAVQFALDQWLLKGSVAYDSAE
eukprot:TRINITY_DN20608_c0_g1_i1.p1 TRINITY_DN20608_c0_g1~~TRINITY_DN20608_c0_g1_i1.p1  ORF type:complete len:476 (+),score=90.27 TRINITY_DN20608_c0_g1_i1:953-2380(+)